MQSRTGLGFSKRKLEKVLKVLKKIKIEKRKLYVGIWIFRQHIIKTAQYIYVYIMCLMSNWYN